VPDDALTPHEAQAMLLHVARRIEDSEDELTDADRAIGDGDHGLAMLRGFDAVRQELESRELETIDELLRTVGRALLSSMGGASGILFSTFFTEGARGLAAQDAFGGEALARLLADGLAAVQKRGKATPGDKTMVDALAPAAQKALELPAAPLAALLPAVVEAARDGVEQTKTMVARTGKAKALGERSLGHPDPGALSAYLILRSMDEYVAARPGPLQRSG
jgi:dihydroxyacetone kinase-like protein